MRTFLPWLWRRCMKPLLHHPRFRYGGPLETLNRSLRYTPKEQMLHDALWYAHCSQLEGEYLEFGVGSGETFSAAYHFLCYLAQRPDASAKTRRRCVGFDSFQGLPSLEGSDGDFPCGFVAGAFAYSQEQVEAFLRASQVPREEVTLVAGWFKDRLTADTKRTLHLQKAAVVWIDCDLYASTADVLPFITNLLQVGTVLVFDDWFTFRGSPYHGQPRAVSEWLAANPRLRLMPFFQHNGWYGVSFLVQEL